MQRNRAADLPQASLYLFIMLQRQGHIGGGELTVVAESTLPAVRTDALKGVHPIDAGPSICTGAADAVVNICGKGLSSFLNSSSV